MDRSSFNSSISASILFAFLIAHLNTSINLIHLILDGKVPILGDLSRAVYRNFQILFNVKGVPLSDTIVSGNPNLANSSCNTFIVVLVVGVVHLKTSSHFVNLSTMTKKCSFYRTGTVNMFVYLRSWIEFYGRCLWLPMHSFCTISP